MTARAHHVERSARQGDVAAVAILREAGEATARLAPESAARWFGAALRLLPQTAPVKDRVELLLARAGALAATGHFADSHEALLDAIAFVPERSSTHATTLTTACARVERFLGRYEQARASRDGSSGPPRAVLGRVRRAADRGDPERVLPLEIRGDARLGRARGQRREGAGRCVPVGSALAVSALAGAMTGPTRTAQSQRAEAAALVDGLSDDELSLRLDAAAWLAAAELYLDLYAEAEAHAGRALDLARTRGRGEHPFGL